MRTKNQDTFTAIQSFIEKFTDSYGYAPTMDEISDGTGYPKTTVHRYVSQMREDGTVDYAGHRSITSTKTKAQSIRVPVLGAVSCGIPKYAEENIEEYIRLPVALFGKGEFFILRAYGDSMIEVGIEDGDLVLIRHQETAEAGQIVVALIDNEDATLKRYYPEPAKHRVRLHPENSNMEDIIVPDCAIQGVAVKVIKDLE